MSNPFDEHFRAELEQLEQQGLCKPERVLLSAQAARVRVADGREVVNFCANNYLGLADDPRIVAAAHAALDTHGFGMASVRFICGTQDLHKRLESHIAALLGSEDAILFPSCFDANAGVFEALLDQRDAIISDALNHASIIDGVRLCKAQRYRYANRDMAELEARLKEAAGARFRLIVTDGVFSMDGTIAPLGEICELAEHYDAQLMVDDSHAVGVLGEKGAGTPSHCGVDGRVGLISGTLGKALGGGSGGYIAGPDHVIGWLRQRARPYLFSNSVAPPVAAASSAALELLAASDELREKLLANGLRFRAEMTALGFDLPAGEHPIVPVMLGDATLAQRMAARLLEEGVYVIGFSFPVVPQGQARIRVQLSAAHSDADIDFAVGCFARAGRELGVIGS